jgi:hypothetical protein
MILLHPLSRGSNLELPNDLPDIKFCVWCYYCGCFFTFDGVERCILTMYIIITVIFWYRGEVTTRSVHTQDFTQSTYPVNDVIAF